MKKLIVFLIIILIFLSCKKGKELPTTFYNCNLNYVDSSFKNSNNLKYQNLLNSITADGVVGITLSVYKPNAGMWLGASGKADLHNDIAMKACNITRVGSTVKTFVATIILKLQEEGKLNIDDKISKYLQGNNISKIKNAHIATIRQLMQHSSGINNYIQDLKFQTASLNNWIKEWNADELLKYSYNKAPYFSPDEDVRYSNTCYILLGLLIEKIEGKQLYKVFEEKIITPLGLANTQFAGKNPVPDGIVRGYIDMYSNFNVIESTYFSGWDYYTADGSLISNVYDMNVFIRALIQGKIINASSLNKMLSWKTPNEVAVDFFSISYGLGIFKIETSKGIAYMHSGDAVGYHADMFYFPNDSTTIVSTFNSNYGKIEPLVSSKNSMEKIINSIK
ncbi:MAG: beta-lactamase family protein [Ferruginibacter sp.]|nr:beta-lactamase family protein [Ferruginibacter sp.]